MQVPVPAFQVTSLVSPSHIPPSNSHQTYLETQCSIPMQPDVNSIPTSNIAPEDLLPGPSKVPRSVNLHHNWEEDDSSGKETKW